MGLSAAPTTAEASPPIDAEALQQAAIRKNAWRMLPLLTLGLVFNYIDRTSIGVAGLTMIGDLGFTATQFGWAAGVLFVGYCLLEIPSNLVLHRVGARRWLARIMVTWGLASALTAFVVGPKSFYAVRFLLGASEAGYFPGVIYLLQGWFPARSRARALAVFTAAVPLSSVIGGPFSALLLQMDGIGGLKGWQWMFLIQGLPACAIGVLVLVFLRDTLAGANWLTPAERDALDGLLVEERRDQQTTRFLTAVTDPRILVLAVIQFGFVVGSYGIGIWLPVILKVQGMATLAIGFASAIPYAFAAIGMLVWARQVDRHGRGIANLAVSCLLGSLGLVLSIVTGSFLLSFVGLTLALVGVTAARAIFWTVPSRFLAGVGAAGGIAFINVFGALGGFVGPVAVGWVKDLTGSFNAGLCVLAGFGLMSAVLTVLLGRALRRPARPSPGG